MLSLIECFNHSDMLAFCWPWWEWCWYWLCYCGETTPIRRGISLVKFDMVQKTLYVVALFILYISTSNFLHVPLFKWCLFWCTNGMCNFRIYVPSHVLRWWTNHGSMSTLLGNIANICFHIKVSRQFQFPNDKKVLY